MKQDWNRISFDDAIEFSQIGIVRNKREQSPDFDYRYFKMDNIKNTNGLDETNFVFINASDEEVKKYKLLEGDFLFNTRNSFELVGKSCLYKTSYPNPTLFNNNILRVRFKPNLSPSFVSYAFSCKEIQEDLEKMKSGTTSVVGIYYKSLRNLILPKPPLNEQKHIVAKLDKCFEAIDKARANVEKNLNNAKELFQSQLNQIFSQKGDGWVEKKLGEVCEKTSNIKWQENQNIEFEYIDLSAVSRETLKITETVSVNSTNAPSRAKKIVKTNDIIFATTRPTLKRVVKISNQYNNQICSTGYVVLRSKNDLIEPEIIFNYLQTEMYMVRMESMQRGASYPAVTDKDVKETIFSYPVSKGEQKITVSKLDKLKSQTQSLESNYQQELDALDELKKSILQKAFNGEL